MNYCVKGRRDGCGENFGSVAAFSAHRIGNHDYLYSEGLNFDPPVEDGRRCLTTWEIQHLTRAEYAALVGNTPPKRGRDELMFARNKHGAWSIAEDLESARRINA